MHILSGLQLIVLFVIAVLYFSGIGDGQGPEAGARMVIILVFLCTIYLILSVALAVGILFKK